MSVWVQQRFPMQHHWQLFAQFFMDHYPVDMVPGAAAAAPLLPDAPLLVARAAVDGERWRREVGVADGDVDVRRKC